ncbi:hypothetical protein BaRGS_00033281, partial [Batillaria attramentaria]
AAADNTSNTAKPDREESGIVISTPTLWMSNSTIPYTQCPAGHVTHDFLACDAQSACWSRDDPSVSCLAPLFTCTNGFERVHYTFVCDYRPDCSDASDENFCVFPTCRMSEFSCGNKQCLPYWQQCDKVEQCANGADEGLCEATMRYMVMDTIPPARIDFDRGQLMELSLAGSPLTQVTMTPLHEVQTLPSLLSLDVSRIPSPELNVHLVYMFPNLETLNMSGSGVDRVQEEGFQLLEHIPILLLHLLFKSVIMFRSPQRQLLFFAYAGFVSHTSNDQIINLNTFRFSAVSPSVRPQLEVVSSPAGVYVQTPGWNGRDLYPDNMDSWARVDIPADHSVMITILE